MIQIGFDWPSPRASAGMAELQCEKEIGKECFMQRMFAGLLFFVAAGCACYAQVDFHFHFAPQPGPYPVGLKVAE
jgi:hypothetical protein